MCGHLCGISIWFGPYQQANHTEVLLDMSGAARFVFNGVNSVFWSDKLVPVMSVA